LALQPGARLNSYEIVSLLGVGGMGEVYRAHDMKLGRDVAIKTLPEAFTADPDRQARFKREAQVLASLNHPHIAAIYGLEDAAGVHALVLELVEGPTLADRINLGPVPIDEALPMARQIADALEAAHDQGIVHRDLKPANIKIKADNSVKVLDFGLAKMLEPEVAASGLSMSPTLSVHATHAGILLGTAAYMSPEQARGKAVDRRADVWAFGCVLFEMLAGRQAFDGGETVSDAIAAILRTEPDWSRLPSDTPAYIRKLLRRCLQKDPQKRLPHIGVARIEIDDGATDGGPSSATQAAVTPAARPALWRRALPAIAASVLVGVLVATAAWTLRPTPAKTPIVRFSIPVPESQVFTTVTRHMLTISPDGTQIAYVANARLYLRAISDLEARPIPGSELNGSVYDPVFSPDGRSIAFWSVTDAAIKKISVSGGPAIMLCPATPPWGLSWGNDGITFGQGSRGVMRVSENGGKPETLAQVKNAEVADSPQTIAGGTIVLFTVAAASPTAPATINQFDKAQIVAQAVGSSERKLVVDGGADARYVPSTGHLVYAVGGVLFSVPFDARRLEITGGAAPILEGVRRSTQTGAAQFSVSSNGTLVYVPGPFGSAAALSELGLFDRTTGAATPLRLPPAAFEHPRISPDGKRITYDVDTGKDANVFVYEVDGSSAARPLTFSGRNKFPIWSGDGEWIVFQSDREGDLGLFRERADGSGNPERLTKPEAGASHIPEAWLPKKDVFLYSESAKTFTLWTFSIQDKRPARFADVESMIPLNAVFSPDGRWVAYTSGDGQLNGSLYVKSFPPTETKYRVTLGQGLQPLWSPDGKEIYYNPAPGQYVRASFSTSPTFSIGNPEAAPRPFVSGGPNTIRNNDMTPDGKVLGIVGSGQAASGAPFAPQLLVVLNWFEELKARVPTH
jgi:Tol biopolymer transport system component